MILLERIDWFNKYFGDAILKEGWYIGEDDNGYDVFIRTYSLTKIKDGIEVSILESKKVISLAKEYGFIFNDWNDIIDFDINKLTRNKHLLTGSELGLL